MNAQAYKAVTELVVVQFLGFISIKMKEGRSYFSYDILIYSCKELNMLYQEERVNRISIICIYG